MSLKGSLETVALPEVLHFLSSTGKSGEFHVSGSRGEGRLWFDGGRVTAFDAFRSQVPAEAIFELLRISDGEFSFAAGAEAPADVRTPADDEGELAPALEAAEERLAEWQDIVAVVPSLSHRVQLLAAAPGDQVVLDPSQWAMVVGIGAGRTVGAVIDERGLQEFDGCRAIRSLVEASLAEVVEPVEEPAVEEPAVEVPVVQFAAEEPVADIAAFEPPVVEPVVFESPVVAEDPEVHVAQEVTEAHYPAPFETVTGAHFAGTSDPADEDTHAAHLLRFGFGAAEPVDEAPYASPLTAALGEAVESAPVEEPEHFASHDADYVPGGDHYAALRAAIVEVEDQLVEPVEVEPAVEAHHAPVYEFDTTTDGRAALQALLSEVSAPEEDPVDGLADRGPWTAHELSTMDGDGGWDQGEQSNIVPFAPVHHAEDDAHAEAYVPTYPEAVAQAPESADEGQDEEEAPPTEEPINRGLLLKFLSSVRN